MLYTQMTNANLAKVGEGMVKMMESLDYSTLGMNPGEKAACIVGLHRALTGKGSPLYGKATCIDLEVIADNMRMAAHHKKLPEYGAAVKYVQKEILI